MSSNGDNSDDDVTKPDLPSGLGATEERTLPGIGPTDPVVSIADSAGRGMAALRALAEACPPPGAVGRRRHLEVLAHEFGVNSDLGHDARRVILQMIREEFGT